MRIVHVSPKGNCIRARRAAVAMAAQGHDVAMVLGKSRLAMDRVLEEDRPIDGVPVFRRNAAYDNKLRDAVLALNPDVVHAHELETMFALLARWPAAAQTAVNDGQKLERCGIEFGPLPCGLIYDTHEYEQGRPLKYINPSMVGTRKWQERSTIGFADAVLAPSPAIAGRLRGDHGLREWPLTVLNSPPSIVRPIHTHEVMRDALGIERETKAIVFCGYITSDRMLYQLGSAYTRLRETDPTWRLFHLGPKMDDPELIEYLESLGTTFFGIQPYASHAAQLADDTMLDYLAAMDVGFTGLDLEWPSWRLAAPNKLFEYAFAGIPQVASEAQDIATWMPRYNLGATYENTVSSLVRALKSVIGEKPDTAGFMRDYAFDGASTQNIVTACTTAIARAHQRMVAA